MNWFVILEHSHLSTIDQHIPLSKEDSSPGKMSFPALRVIAPELYPVPVRRRPPINRFNPWCSVIRVVNWLVISKIFSDWCPTLDRFSKRQLNRRYRIFSMMISNRLSTSIRWLITQGQHRSWAPGHQYRSILPHLWRAINLRWMISSVICRWERTRPVSSIQVIRRWFYRKR